MTLEHKRIDVLYELLESLEGGGEEEAAAALRWAIYELERMYAD